MARKKKLPLSGIEGVRGKRTEGTLLKVPVERKAPKSEFLLKLESQQKQKPVLRTIKELNRAPPGEYVVEGEASAEVSRRVVATMLKSVK